MGTLWVRSTPASAATVRHSLTYDLKRHGYSDALADDAALLASELVTNAVRHAHALPSGHLAVTWQVDADGVTMQVTDGGGQGRPELRHVSFDDTSGRGLAIVAALADDWGIDEHPGGSTVWARLGRSQHSPA